MHLVFLQGSVDCCSAPFSHSVVSDSLWPHGLQHVRLLCPSPTPRACSNSCPPSWWCHLIICHLILLPTSIFPSIRVFSKESVLPISGQIIGVSASASVLPMNIQDWFPLGLTGLILQSRDSQESSPVPQFKRINSSMLSFLCSPTLTPIHDYWKTIALTRWAFVGKVVSLLFNMLSRLVIAFLPRSKCLFNFMAAVNMNSDFWAQVSL